MIAHDFFQKKTIIIRSRSRNIRIGLPTITCRRTGLRSTSVCAISRLGAQSLVFSQILIELTDLAMHSFNSDELFLEFCYLYSDVDKLITRRSPGQIKKMHEPPCCETRVNVWIHIAWHLFCTVLVYFLGGTFIWLLFYHSYPKPLLFVY